MTDLESLDPPTADTQLTALRGKIGWICQGVRFAALGYAIWIIYLLITYWSSVEAISNGYGRMLHKDLSGIEPWQQAAAFGVHFLTWLIAAAACYSAWRLFTSYLKGDIFTSNATIWLRRVAYYGAIAQLFDIATRPLVSVILTWHFPPGQNLRIVNVFLLPNDLVVLLLLFGLLALAHIQKTAAEIAGENAQFV